MKELNSTMKYSKYNFTIEVNAGVVRSCGKKSNSSGRALAVSQVQPATASREVAAAVKPGQRVGAAEEPGQKVKSPGSANTQNLWEGESRAMGSADNQNLWPGENTVSRSNREIYGETSGAEKKKQIKSKCRKGKRRRGKNCHLPGEQAKDEMARGGGAKNNLPALVAKQYELCWQNAGEGNSELANKPGNLGHLQCEDHVLSVPLRQDTPAAAHDNCSENGISVNEVPNDAATDSNKVRPYASHRPTGNAIEHNQLKPVGLNAQKRNMGRVVRYPRDGPGFDQTSFPETGESRLKLGKDADGPGFDQTSSPAKG